MKPHLQAPDSGRHDPPPLPPDRLRQASLPTASLPSADGLAARLVTRLLTRIRLPKAPDKSPLDRARARKKRSVTPAGAGVMRTMGRERARGGRRR